MRKPAFEDTFLGMAASALSLTLFMLAFTFITAVLCGVLP